MSDTKYVTLDELATHVGVKVSTVRQWVKRGFIPRDTYIRAGNTYRFCVEDVVAALRKEEPKGQHEAAVEKAVDNLREGDERPERDTVTRAMVEDVINEYEEETKSSAERDVEDMLSELDDDI